MQTGARTGDKLTIGVLYGFRALMVLFVCNYHIWQQGWLAQYAVIFGQTVDFDFWTRSSYAFVDGMILLSGFLLYLPYARQAQSGAFAPAPRRFYWNRLVRIIPSYMASVLLVLLLVTLPQGAYRDVSVRNLDVITHLTFTFTFFRDTYLYTPLNGVLWTIAIEMQFYLFFPLLVRAMRKKPALTLCVMGAAGILFRAFMARYVSDLSLWVNQLPSFLDVYALGMLGAILYLKIQKGVQALPGKGMARRVAALSALVLFAAGCWLLTQLIRAQTDHGLISQDQLRLWQWLLRLPLAATLLTLMLSAAFMPRLLQKLLDNRLMRFLSTISLNLYIWHQVLSVQIARNLFPATLHTDSMLQRAYTLTCFAVSILAAMAATYGVEQPAARLLEKARKRYQMNKETNHHEGSQNAETLPADGSLRVRPEGGRTGGH